MSNLSHTVTTNTFAGAIVFDKASGKKKIEVFSHIHYQHEINKFRVGDKVTMSVTNKRPKRTAQQNRYYWGAYLPAIAQETGEHEIDRLHALFKSKFLTVCITEVLGQKVRITKSTTELSVSEFIEFIMNVEALTGVAAPPTEVYGLAEFNSPINV